MRATALTSCAPDGSTSERLEPLPELRLLGPSGVSRVSDEREFYGAGRLDLSACNNLQCQRCGQAVRAVDDRAPAREDLEPDELYGQANWIRSADLRRGEAPSRHYGCQRSQTTVTTPLLIDEVNLREDLLTLLWSCDGHLSSGTPRNSTAS